MDAHENHFSHFSPFQINSPATILAARFSQNSRVLFGPSSLSSVLFGPSSPIESTIWTFLPYREYYLDLPPLSRVLFGPSSPIESTIWTFRPIDNDYIKYEVFVCISDEVISCTCFLCSHNGRYQQLWFSYFRPNR